ncbi:hypothetical protein X971_2642 [Agrobacterium tumefaciens LBA4213 (Ach5)]|nr:hypothetical protein X971_2642 [Agrobacterium tumefaciens LBA4213 (Ach5)]
MRSGCCGVDGLAGPEDDAPVDGFVPVVALPDAADDDVEAKVAGFAPAEEAEAALASVALVTGFASGFGEAVSGCLSAGFSTWGLPVAGSAL